MDNKQYTPQQILNESYEWGWAISIVGWVWWNWVENDIQNDAWGRMKVYQDISIFHSLFTFNIPSVWLCFDNWVEIANDSSLRISSVDWTWIIKSWAVLWDTWFLRSKRHPRYQPNRWHLYSTAWFMPSPTATWIRKAWLLDTIVQVCFLLEDWVLYAYIMNDWVDKYKQAIDLSAVWMTVADLAFWTLYDVQFQWRWVWDYYFYINQKLVHTAKFLWNNTELTIANPAISAWFYCENTDWTEVEIHIWCIDITSEWWKTDEAEYRSVANSTIKAVNTANYPTLIIHSKETFFWKPNSRDIQMFRATWSADQKSYMKAYATRDLWAITWASFTDIQSDSSVEYDVSATAINTWLCQLLWSRRINVDDSISVDIPSRNTDFYLTPWDYLIITMERENPTQTSNVTCTLEFGEEI